MSGAGSLPNKTQPNMLNRNSRRYKSLDNLFEEMPNNITPDSDNNTTTNTQPDTGRSNIGKFSDDDQLPEITFSEFTNNLSNLNQESEMLIHSIEEDERSQKKSRDKSLDKSQDQFQDVFSQDPSTANLVEPNPAYSTHKIRNRKSTSKNSQSEFERLIEQNNLHSDIADDEINLDDILKKVENY